MQRFIWIHLFFIQMSRFREFYPVNFLVNLYKTHSKFLR